ncbi:phosphodiester glycosidase family protein [Niabella terrae]
MAVVQKEWKTTRIAKGLIWKQGHFDQLFGSVQEINFVEVNLRKYRKRLRLAADARVLKKTSDFARSNQALVAVNGGFFDIKNGGAVDFIQVNGAVINEQREKTSRANALLLFSRKSVKIKGVEQLERRQAQRDYPNILCSGPLLVQSGADMIAGKKNAFNENRHPRTAVALKGKHTLILLVVDGRNAQAQGMSLPELSRVFRWLGATDAMNLDGGGSSTLYIRDMTPNGVVNYPSDNKKFDHNGQRRVANILLVR